MKLSISTFTDRLRVRARDEEVEVKLPRFEGEILGTKPDLAEEFRLMVRKVDPSVIRSLDVMRAAGVLLRNPDGEYLFLKRTDAGEMWALPGGGLNLDETPEQAARRELFEETGFRYNGTLRPLHEETNNDVNYTTFISDIPFSFAAKLNHEHSDWKWSRTIPTPLHPGVARALSKTRDTFKEADHPRGQPNNAGQFAETHHVTVNHPGGIIEVHSGPGKPEATTNLSDEEITKHLQAADEVMHSIPETYKIDTPARQALRQKVANDLYNKDIENRRHDRVATIILGLPGSGKSTLAAPLMKGAVEIDPDNAKAMLPEYHDGMGAYALHEESSAIMRNVLAKAVVNGDNLVWPRIDSPDKIKADIASMKRAGYRVNVKLLTISSDDAVKSVIQRFLQTGRYVSPVVVKGFGDSPKQAYEAAKAAGVDGSEEYVRGDHGDFRKVG